MLEGVDVYRDRDKYLLRSLQVTGRMESLIQEMLNISRVEQGIVTVEREAVGLAALLEKQLSQDAGLLEQRGQRLSACLTTEITVEGDPSLLGKAVGNLLSNAALYSPEGAEIRVWCGLLDGCPALTVENTGAHIGEEALLLPGGSLPEPEHRRQRPGALSGENDPGAARSHLHH